MQIARPDSTAPCHELELIGRYLNLEQAMVLELGCGNARMTRQIAERFPITRIIATEVDRIQHQKNLASAHPATLTFADWGAQNLPLPDNSVDGIFMFKSLHHVPSASMNQALSEIARVLRPDGWAWLSEPVYAGDFNNILRLFNDEKAVREQAFAAIRHAVASGILRCEQQIFCQATTQFADFQEFEQRILRATHTQHRLDAALYATVRERFEAHLGSTGAHFDNPMRIDLLRKP